jgi:cystathionine gamma-synthase
MTNPRSVEQAIRCSTELLWIETPSNPLLKVTDIRRICAIGRKRGIQVICDSSWASPAVTRPLDLGADIVLHSTTKYLGGHTDVMGGALIFSKRDETFERVRMMQASLGAVPSPFDCWLIMRGIRTLDVRLHRQSANALAIAQYLEDHPSVERVHYPGLEAHPQHSVARRQMRLFGGMLSIEINGDAARAMEIVGRCNLLTRATSLGGVETLIEHRASNEPPDTATPQNLIRISVGIEGADNIIDELAVALAT